MLDAALDALDAGATIVCPALPVNGRTVYMGHLFVGDTLLSESPLSRHPLNPMTDANLVRWLGYQTQRAVGLVPLADIRSGDDALGARMEALRREGVSYLVTDAVADSDLDALARAVRGWPLVSGGSGITAALGRVAFPGRSPLDFTDRLAALPPGTLVVSGSQSPMTRRQNAHAVSRGFTHITLDIPAVLEGRFDPDRTASKAAGRLQSGEPVIVGAPGEDEAGLRATQALGASLGLSQVATGEKIAAALAETAARVLDSGAVGRLVVSGGETSGAVCRRLGLRALEVGLPIAPGVPCCFPAGRDGLLVVLKSGNFGGEDLYVRTREL
jgi:uncharacterized protein YgbK (DUF1537 family)